mgnify:CR=1 FL=1
MELTKEKLIEKIAKYTFAKGGGPTVIVISAEDYAMLVNETGNYDLEEFQDIPLAVVQSTAWKDLKLYGVTN